MIKQDYISVNYKEYHNELSVADPGFPVGGRRPVGGADL